MTYGINYSLFHCIDGKLWSCGDICFFSLFACPNPIIDTAHHKTRGLVNKLNHITSIYLICRHRLFYYISIELHTFNFRCNEVFLWFLSKQQYCRIC